MADKDLEFYCCVASATLVTDGLGFFGGLVILRDLPEIICRAEYIEALRLRRTHFTGLTPDFETSLMLVSTSL